MRTDPAVDLEAEVAALRREVAALRDALACEVRTRRIVVEDGDRQVTVEPGAVAVEHEATGCRIVLYANPGRAEVVVAAGDAIPSPVELGDGPPVNVGLIATLDNDFEPGGPHAEVCVNGQPLPAG